jgi:hypothetical protein
MSAVMTDNRETGPTGTPVGVDIHVPHERQTTVRYRSFEASGWQAFEREVASIYRVLGAKVKHNAALAGMQIDLVTRARTNARRLINEDICIIGPPLLRLGLFDADF